MAKMLVLFGWLQKDTEEVHREEWGGKRLKDEETRWQNEICHIDQKREEALAQADELSHKQKRDEEVHLQAKVDH